MKADILRRAEEISDSSDSEKETIDSGGKYANKTAAFEEDLDDDVHVNGGRVKVIGDGEDSGESEEEGGAGEQDEKQAPETVLELAYLRDPKLFDRDGQTRRGKGRADMKLLTGMLGIATIILGLSHAINVTGWSDEQIEGWKIMLERNVSRTLALYTFC